jgi:osmotically-inducible protein OsmY
MSPHSIKVRVRSLSGLLIVGAACLSLGGCAAAVIGGAAAGGYYIGKDERSASQIADDAAITATVKAKLIADAEVKALDINVSTYENVVILEGKVATAGQRYGRHRTHQVAPGRRTGRAVHEGHARFPAVRVLGAGRGGAAARRRQLQRT